MEGKIGLTIWCVAVAVVIFCMPFSSALPTTGAATLVGSNNATVTMTGAATTCWFEWGMLAGDSMTWKTPNNTPAAGVCTYTIRGSPITGSTVWYFRACDATGCGADGTFTTAAVTAIPTSTYGATFENLTDTNFDITLIGAATMAPYMWILPTYHALIWGLVFMFLFVGIWLRGRDMGYIVIFALIIGVILFSSASYGIAVGVPQEFADIGQGIVYAAVAGVILSIIKK